MLHDNSIVTINRRKQGLKLPYVHRKKSSHTLSFQKGVPNSDRDDCGLNPSYLPLGTGLLCYDMSHYSHQIFVFWPLYSENI